MKTFYVYILKCSDESYYTGLTSDLEKRFMQHQEGWFQNCFTFKRRPLQLVFYQEFSDFNEAMLFEKKIKSWSRIKKKALIDERWEDLIILSKNYTEFGKPNDPSTSSG